MSNKYSISLSFEKTTSLKDINDQIIESVFEKVGNEFKGVKRLLEVNDATIIHALWRRGWEFNKSKKQWRKV